jgi:hypothetical protein
MRLPNFLETFVTRKKGSATLPSSRPGAIENRQE